VYQVCNTIYENGKRCYTKQGRDAPRMAALLPAPCPSRPVLTTAACGLLALVLVLATRPSHPTAALTTAGAAAAAVDAIVVLAGGVDETGVPHESVLRRLRAAARHHHASSASGIALPILLNGGGTTHTPKWVDREGYAVPEAALMGRYLCKTLGVPATSIYIEGYSDDTLGESTL